MNAITWLARQLAWERRLGELRSEVRPTNLLARAPKAKAKVSPKAA